MPNGLKITHPCATLSQIVAKVVPIAILVAGTGCADEAKSGIFMPEPAPDQVAVAPESVWRTSIEDTLVDLLVEPTTEDVVTIGLVQVARFDVDGTELFRHVLPQSMRPAVSAAFDGEGNLYMLVDCNGPSEINGTPVCSSSSQMTLVELARNGEVARTADLGRAGGANAGRAAIALGDDKRIHVVGTYFNDYTVGDFSIEAPDTSSMFYLQLDADMEPTLLQGFGSLSATATGAAIDPTTGDLFAIGTFAGNLQMPGYNLWSGPNGRAIFLMRLADDGEPRWAKHFSGAGTFGARFADDGDLLIDGRGSAPLTSLGGDAVIDGPFATRLDGDGAHLWTWRAQDQLSQSDATVDADGRVIAAYTEVVTIAEEKEPEVGCFEDWNPECQYQPAVSRYDRVLMVASPTDGELGRTIIGTGIGRSLIAAAPDGTIVVADEAADNNGVWGYGATTVSKFSLTPSD